MKLRNLLLVFVLLIPFLSCAGKKVTTEYIVQRVTISETLDIGARKNPVFDINGDACALVKVVAGTYNDLLFEGSGIYKVKRTGKGTYDVWMLDGSKGFTIYMDNMRPFPIIFQNYGDVTRLNSKTTYDMQIHIKREDENVHYKSVDTFVFDEAKNYFFLTYQLSYGFPYGLNFAVCKKHGWFLSLSYVNDDYRLAWQEEEEDNYGNKRALFNIGTGPMFRLNPNFYVQAGISLSLGSDEEFYLNLGASVFYRIKRFTIGCGYYYFGSSFSQSYGKDRKGILDGLTLNIGFSYTLDFSF